MEEEYFGRWRDLADNGDLALAVHDDVDGPGEPVGQVEGEEAGRGEGALLLSRFRCRNRPRRGGVLDVFPPARGGDGILGELVRRLQVRCNEGDLAGELVRVVGRLAADVDAAVGIVGDHRGAGEGLVLDRQGDLPGQRPLGVVQLQLPFDDTLHVDVGGGVDLRRADVFQGDVQVGVHHAADLDPEVRNAEGERAPLELVHRLRKLFYLQPQPSQESGVFLYRLQPVVGISTFGFQRGIAAGDRVVLDGEVDVHTADLVGPGILQRHGPLAHRIEVLLGVHPYLDAPLSGQPLDDDSDFKPFVLLRLDLCLHLFGRSEDGGGEIHHLGAGDGLLCRRRCRSFSLPLDRLGILPLFLGARVPLPGESAVLLHRVAQLVGQQPFPLAGAGLVLVAGEEDVVLVREGTRGELAPQVGRFGIVVNPDAAEVRVEARFHETARL